MIFFDVEYNITNDNHYQLRSRFILTLLHILFVGSRFYFLRLLWHKKKTR